MINQFLISKVFFLKCLQYIFKFKESGFGQDFLFPGLLPFMNKKTGISVFWKKRNQSISIIIPVKYFPELIVPDEN